MAAIPKNNDGPLPSDSLWETAYRRTIYSPTAARRADKLTPRCRAVLQGVALGFTTEQIAEQIKISPKTVEFHRAKVQRTLQLWSYQDLTRFAVLAGLVPLDPMAEP